MSEQFKCKLAEVPHLLVLTGHIHSDIERNKFAADDEDSLLLPNEEQGHDVTIS